MKKNLFVQNIEVCFFISASLGIMKFLYLFQEKKFVRWFPSRDKPRDGTRDGTGRDVPGRDGTTIFRPVDIPSPHSDYFCCIMMRKLLLYFYFDFSLSFRLTNWPTG